MLENMKIYRVQTHFTFPVDAFVRAENEDTAKEIVEKGLFMNLTSGIHCDPTKEETKVGRLGWTCNSSAEQKIISVEQDNSRNAIDNLTPAYGEGKKGRTCL